MSTTTEELYLPRIEQNRKEYERIMDLAYISVDNYAVLGIDTRQEGFREHAERTAELFSSFAGERIPQVAAVVALTHDVIDRSINEESSKFSEERSSVAKALLQDFYSQANLPKNVERYLKVVSHGLVRTEIASGEHRKEVAAKTADSLSGIQVDVAENMISDNYEGKLPPEVWSAVQPYLDFQHMANFINTIDIDSVVIKGCELVDNLKNPSSMRESAWLQDVLEAESFYAPLLELLRFDGLASLLRSEAHILRLNMSGKAASISEASRVLTPIENLGPKKIIESILGVDDCDYQPAVTGQPAPPVHVGDAVVSIDNELQSVHYRLKTVGSLAQKIESDAEKRVPLDLMGMTVVCGDVESSAHSFAHFIKNNVDGNQFIRPESAPSKTQAIYAQGSEEYIRSVQEELIDLGIELNRCEFKYNKPDEVHERGYENLQVSKITFKAMVDGVEVPTEVQFVTNDERRRMRDGEIAHIVFKYIRQENNMRKFHGRELLTLAEEGNIASAAKVLFSGLKERINVMNNFSYTVNSFAAGYYETGKLVD